MTLPLLLLLILVAMALAYHLVRKQAIQRVGGVSGIKQLHSLPAYYGYYAAFWVGIPALLILLAWFGLQDRIITALMIDHLPDSITAGQSSGQISLIINDIKNLATGNITSGTITEDIQAAADHYARLQGIAKMSLWVLILAAALAGMSLAWRRAKPDFRARNRVENAVLVVMIVFSSIAIITTLGIVLSVLFESILFFQEIPWTQFFFGTEWSPQIALRADQVGASGAFGAIPLFTGTLLISAIAMLVAVPIGLFSAIYLSEYAAPAVRGIAKPLLEILAGIPTVVYGFFAALTVAPYIRELGESMGLNVASESALAAGLVMGIMIIPFVSSLSDDVINAVPQSMRDGSHALGATQSETIRRVIFPAALPGIVGGVLLAVSRAIGETMIVVMAAGLAANLTANPLDSVTTVTVQIVTLLTGDQEFDSAKTLAAFALGLTLFVVTLALNVIALHIVRKYREQYE
ncbi:MULTISPECIES: phosphate ABC transporter permease subunit PstC [Thiorhodovibrio]|uniref:phosphate ABC transporter permease subunit PstC n=1 Tax=Thiorhodovibrio TaxID=61593 RepID=UPI001912EF46|nr:MULTISPECIES: phosphate ABC transporter permease subunit PstC [Thiorhodovibrio]MBK5967550.1 phosphate ABC transporter permease subunit PstC [Thiorhodovibrio winogradskyi]WPL14055.1 Phosphate transport system permease protein PstC [Thiorhodovibrio litoralis]